MHTWLGKSSTEPLPAWMPNSPQSPIFQFFCRTIRWMCEGVKMDMSLSYCCSGATNKLLMNLQPLRFCSSTARTTWKPLRCTPLEEQVDGGILCEPCKGRGWQLCDFCKGQKTNVKAENNRIYRRCPSCRAVGYILCSKCKCYLSKFQ